MTYIFTAPQLAGVIQQALETDDPLILENVAFLAELFYQDCKTILKNSQTNHGLNDLWIQYSKPMLMAHTNKIFVQISTIYRKTLYYPQSPSNKS